MVTAMNFKPLALLAGTLLASSMLSACAASLCERRDNFMHSSCAGTNVTYGGDPMCENKIKKCSPAHLAQFEGYVACLEAKKVCSMEVLASCAERFPGGVNLVCN